ncbi:ATP-binding protein [Streptomyces sp. KMM 9044]|uniref:ATP-binding protein n=1 Tax=Streptomyces sp. KMM 9044 TaxID=2744474 RepID=UPI002151D86F|nr:ATP-binding protein [Streptomyces sp. KMM 9044]WAX78110.1 ATP-binding protein [Streptomyces sp. KMM 9044]
MSLPLTRRIARATLLVAAGAAAGVGAAGSACAAPELPITPSVGGLTVLDEAGAAGTVDDAAHTVTDTTGNAGGQALEQAAGDALPADAVSLAGVPAARTLPATALPLG